MANIRIESQGFSIGRWCFPPFTVRGGECVTLRLPQEALADEDRVIRCFTGKDLVPGLRVDARVLYAQRASNPSGWRSWFQAPTPLAWLKRNTTLSDDTVRSVLHKHKIDARLPLNRYAGTPKVLLGLEAAYASSSEVVVFSTSGLDPMGVRATFQVVAERLTQSSAVYLSWPILWQEQLGHDCFPGSSEVTVVDSEPALVR